MIVVDASAWVTGLVDSGERGEESRRVLSSDVDWAAPPHAPVEVVRTLIRFLRAGAIQEHQADRLVAQVAAASVRYSAIRPQLLVETWMLRDAVSAYDAPYVILARSLGAPLITLDHKLARAARSIEVAVIVPGES